MLSYCKKKREESWNVDVHGILQQQGKGSENGCKVRRNSEKREIMKITKAKKELEQGLKRRQQVVGRRFKLCKKSLIS